MTAKNKIRPDIVLKNFWRDSGRFADLFNGTLFKGEKVLDPETLAEADTDLSSVLKLNSYAGTLGKLLDVAKRSADGADFIILGLENQMKVHYAMPLRGMAGDTLMYLKEYTELAKRNREAGNWDSGDEFLSGMRKTDRLHPAVTLCIYYGENPWDGPLSLTDMLDMEGMPPQLAEVMNDYKMNLVQIPESGHYRFSHPEVQDFFEIMRSIYRRDYRRIEEIYAGREISGELGLAVGAAAESETLMKKALERKGEVMNMCTALKELEDEGRIDGILKTCRDFGISREAAEEKIRRECGLNQAKAAEYAAKYYS